MRYWVGLYLEDKQQLLIIAGVEKVRKTAIKIFGKKQEGDIPRLTTGGRRGGEAGWCDAET
jgi:hypothetical protein